MFSHAGKIFGLAENRQGDMFIVVAKVYLVNSGVAAALPASMTERTCRCIVGVGVPEKPNQDILLGLSLVFFSILRLLK